MRALVVGVCLVALVLPAPTVSSATSMGDPPRKVPLTKGDRLHIQFTERLQVSKGVQAVELDGESASKRQVRQLRRAGYRTICYVSAGSWESSRKDARRFSKKLIGNQLDGWPKERWLDIRNRNSLRPIMRNRIRDCSRKGFNGIEFDNVDGYQNRTGFRIKRHHQIGYNKMLAKIAKQYRLSPGLKNAVDLVKTLAKYFDWALNEECSTSGECGKYRPFIRRGKAVVILEYGAKTKWKVCRSARQLRDTAQMKRLNLKAWTRHC